MQLNSLSPKKTHEKSYLRTNNLSMGLKRFDNRTIWHEKQPQYAIVSYEIKNSSAYQSDFQTIVHGRTWKLTLKLRFISIH